jgi:hypothetical protein
VASVASGSYRELALAHIDELRAAGTVEVTSYRFELVRAVPVKVPGSSQNAPEVGLDVRATVTRETRGPGSVGGSAERPVPYRATFRMALNEVGDRYVIAGPGESWTGPTR